MGIGRARAVLIGAAAVLSVSVIGFVQTSLANDSPIRGLVTATAPEPPVGANSPEAALAQFVATLTLPFAGPCDATQSPRDVGRLCGRFVAERAPDGMEAYLIGRTFSEFTTWVFLAVRGGSWLVVVDVALDDAGPTLTIPWPPLG
jgi:hypothetical protein